MSSYSINEHASGAIGPILELTADSATIAAPYVATPVIPSLGNINVTGASTNDSNFLTVAIAPATLLITNRYQGTTTTDDAPDGQTQTIITIPVSVATMMEIAATFAGIEIAGPNGVAGSIEGAVFRGAAGGAVLLGTSVAFIATTAGIPSATFAIGVSGNNAIITVTGQATFTIEWNCLANLTVKSFI